MTSSRLLLLCLPAFFVTLWPRLLKQCKPLRCESLRLTAKSCCFLSDSTVGPSDDSSSKGMHYAVDFRGKWPMDESMLGLEIQGQPALGPGMKQVQAQSGQADESYSIPVGKTSSVRDHYNSAHVDFEDPSGRKLAMEVRAFDDGVAFR